VGRVHALDGQVLLLGVTHSENTTLHLAESLAQVPYSVSHPCVVNDGDRARTVLIAETDHCCSGFRQLDDWLRAESLQREGKVGNGASRLCNARDLVDVSLEHLASDPLVFLCPSDAGCGECDLARASVPGTTP
jgi:aminoglycoside 3-N-acetyltransferase